MPDGSDEDEKEIAEEIPAVPLYELDVDTLEPEQVPYWVQSLAEVQAMYPSPVDINISNTKILRLTSLEWYNFDRIPKKLKLTNTGSTVIMSGKWYQERPYISNGPFLGKYVFAQLHFHWGKNDMEGSEHSYDGCKCPGEMHVVFFKSCYLTQEAAMKEIDGIAILVYVLKLQTTDNPTFHLLVENFYPIQYATAEIKFEPFAIDRLLRKFVNNYFLYWGSVCRPGCTHSVLWVISREPIGASSEQMEEFRSLLQLNDRRLLRNFRNVKPLETRDVLFVNPAGSTHSTLLPIPKHSFN